MGGNVFSGFSGYDLDVAEERDTGVTLTITDVGLNAAVMGAAIQASIETIRRRVDQPSAPPSRSSSAKAATAFWCRCRAFKMSSASKTLIGETGKLEFKLVDPSADASQVAKQQAVPTGDELVYGDGDSRRFPTC